MGSPRSLHQSYPSPGQTSKAGGGSLMPEPSRMSRPGTLQRPPSSTGKSSKWGQSSKWEVIASCWEGVAMPPPRPGPGLAESGGASSSPVLPQVLQQPPPPPMRMTSPDAPACSRGAPCREHPRPASWHPPRRQRPAVGRLPQALMAPSLTCPGGLSPRCTSACGQESEAVSGGQCNTTPRCHRHGLLGPEV